MYDDVQGTVRLAPAYDLVCTTLYDRADTMALTLNESKAFPTAKELESFGRLHCDVPPGRAKKLLQRVAAGVAQASEDMRQYAREHKNFGKAAERLIGRFNHGLQRLDLA